MKIFKKSELVIENNFAESINYTDALAFAYSKIPELLCELPEACTEYMTLLDRCIENKIKIQDLIRDQYPAGFINKDCVFFLSNDNTVQIYEVGQLPKSLICNVEAFFGDEVTAVVRAYYLFDRTRDSLTFGINKRLNDDTVKTLLKEYEEAACALFYTTKAFEEFIGSTSFPIGLYSWSIDFGRNVVVLTLQPEFESLS